MRVEHRSCQHSSLARSPWRQRDYSHRCLAFKGCRAGASPAPQSSPEWSRRVAVVTGILGSSAHLLGAAEAKEKYETMEQLKGKDYGKERQRYSDYTRTESGLQYQDIRIGSGEAPTQGSTVSIDWDGYTIGYYGRPFQARNKARFAHLKIPQDSRLICQTLSEHNMLPFARLGHLPKRICPKYRMPLQCLMLDGWESLLGANPAIKERCLTLQAKGGSFGQGADRDLFSFQLGSQTAIPAVEEAVSSMRQGGIRRLIVPVELGYPDNDFNKKGPKPTTFSGQRALDFVLKNRGLIDKTLLIDVELVKIS